MKNEVAVAIVLGGKVGHLAPVLASLGQAELLVGGLALLLLRLVVVGQALVVVGAAVLLAHARHLELNANVLV